MKRIRANDLANDVGLGRAARITAFGVALCVTIMGFTVLAGCNRADEPALAPQLLFDADEIAVYLDEFPKDDYQIAEVAGLGKFYIDDNPALVKTTLLSGEPWEPHVIKELENHLAPGDTALDIGAHIGSLTVPMARLVGPEGMVYAFEPVRKIYRELAYNLELNELDNAVPLRFALSSEAGIIEMKPTNKFDGRTSVGRGGDKVEARTIDSFGFPDVALMKIDVEGHEVEVLVGAANTIGAFHPVIIIEIWKHHHEKVLLVLEDYGYSVRKIRKLDFLAIYEPEP